MKKVMGLVVVFILALLAWTHRTAKEQNIVAQPNPVAGVNTQAGRSPLEGVQLTYRPKEPKILPQISINSRTQKVENRLQDHQEVAKKVLRTLAERLQHERDLASSEMVAQTLSIMTIDTDEKVRMQAGSYLMHAMDWKQNPNRAAILQQVSDWLSQAPNIEMLGERQQRSLVADRMELYATLYDNAPSKAEQLLRQSGEGLNQRIMTAAYNFYIRASKQKTN